MQKGDFELLIVLQPDLSKHRITKLFLLETKELFVLKNLTILSSYQLLPVMSETPSYKCILTGDLGVGKSALVLHALQINIDDQEMRRLPGLFYIEEFSFQAKKIKLQIWDTAGQEKYKSMAPFFYRDSFGAILVYDITNRESFVNIARWFDEAKENCDAQKISMVLVGNKVDMKDERVVSYEEGERFARENEMMFFESSNKTAESVKEVWAKMAEMVYKKVEESDIAADNESSRVKLKDNQQNPQLGNCAC